MRNAGGPIALGLLLCSVFTACAETAARPAAPVLDGAAPPAASPTADSPERTGRQIMVMLRPVPPPLIAQRTGELQVNYRLRTVLSWPLASLGETCVVYEVPPGRSPESLVQRLATDPRVSSAQLIQVFETLAAPVRPNPEDAGDPYAHLQYGARTIRLEQAHRWATGKGVKVAVVDTGVDLGHPDLRIAKASSFVDRGDQTFTSDVHGTAVAGVIAAIAGNQVGIAGVAPDADVFAFKACWPRAPGSRQALCNSYTLLKAISAAIDERAQVINFSLGGPDDPLLARILRKAMERGITVVAAAGSEDPARPGGGEPTFPASLAGVIAVAGSDVEGNLPSAPRGQGDLLAAPGVDILTTVPRGAYDFFTGSSLAAAEVSGVVALLLEKNPKLTPAELRALIESTAHPLRAGDPPGGTDGAGRSDPPARRTGMVDACAALAKAAGKTCP